MQICLQFRRGECNFLSSKILTQYLWLFKFIVFLISNLRIKAYAYFTIKAVMTYSVLLLWHITLKCCMLKPYTVYPKKYAHGFCFAVLCCGYTLTDFPISIRLTSLALWQSNDCPSASKATLMNMDKYVMWIHYERLHNHNKAKHNKTVRIFLGIYCKWHGRLQWPLGLVRLKAQYSGDRMNELNTCRLLRKPYNSMDSYANLNKPNASGLFC